MQNFLFIFFFLLQVGRPIRNGTYAAKKMVASVYSKVNHNKQSVQFDIFVNNAIEDQSNVRMYIECELRGLGKVSTIEKLKLSRFM